MFVPFLQDAPAGIEDLYVLDESAALYGFSLLEHGDDPVLRDLASRARSRRLFDYVEYEDEAQLERSAGRRRRAAMIRAIMSSRTMSSKSRILHIRGAAAHM